MQLPFADARVRRGRLPVRRDVLSRQGRRPMPRRGACCAAAAYSSSTSGIGSRRTSSPTPSPTRWPALFPGDPPRFMARTPHGYHDARAIAHDLAQGGFRSSRRRSSRSRSAAGRHRRGIPAHRLLPGHAAAQRDRIARTRRAWAKRRSGQRKRSCDGSAPVPSTARSRLTSSASQTNRSTWPSPANISAPSRPWRPAPTAARTASPSARSGTSCASASICGHVGCCEDSEHAHALQHFNKTGHPMIASFERGETPGDGATSTGSISIRCRAGSPSGARVSRRS